VGQWQKHFASLWRYLGRTREHYTHSTGRFSMIEPVAQGD
jgi:hypothetical protein